MSPFLNINMEYAHLIHSEDAEYGTGPLPFRSKCIK
jgi:hypothetical protein